jgi:hypothetical protein
MYRSNVTGQRQKYDMIRGNYVEIMAVLVEEKSAPSVLSIVNRNTFFTNP